MYHSSTQSKLTSSNVYFCPTNNPKLKDIQITIIENRKAANPLRLEPVNGWHFYLTNDYFHITDCSKSIIFS